MRRVGKLPWSIEFLPGQWKKPGRKWKKPWFFPLTSKGFFHGFLRIFPLILPFEAIFEMFQVKF